MLRRGVEVGRLVRPERTQAAPSRSERPPGLGETAGPGIERRPYGRPQEQPILIYVDTSVLAAYYCPEPLSGKASGRWPRSMNG